LARVQPVLAVLGKSITHVGPVGAGHTAKAINNLISAATLAGVQVGKPMRDATVLAARCVSRRGAP